VRGLEDTGAGLVLGGEHDSVLEFIYETIDMVDLVDLGPGKVKDDYGLQGVGVRDVGLADGENSSVLLADQVSGEPGFADVSLVVMVRVKLALRDWTGEDAQEFMLPRAQYDGI
jgi:hypothetical protein